MDSKAEESRKNISTGSKRKSTTKVAAGPLILPPPIIVSKQIKKKTSSKKPQIIVDGGLCIGGEIPPYLQDEDTVSQTSLSSDESIIENDIMEDQKAFPEEQILEGEKEEANHLVSEMSSKGREEVQLEETEGFEQGTEVQLEHLESKKQPEDNPFSEEENIFLENSGECSSSEPQTEIGKKVRKLRDYQLWIEEFLLEQELEVAFCKELGEGDVGKQVGNEPKESLKPVNPVKPKDYSLIRLPVILSETDLEYEIFDSYPLPAPISTIIKSEWSVHSIEARVPLPSNIAFIKGTLVLILDYTCEKQTLHSVKVQVPWSHTLEVDWLVKPEISKSEKKEYMFRASDCDEPSLHYEYCAEYAKPVHFDLSEVNFVWHEELDKPVNKSKIAIHGIARFSLNLLQEQYVKISLE
ncbi:hypothetical protein JOC95_003979 [Bacillus tianshenii]|uniref:Uncharacterized protein n=1 Tax=Sutcliffiella tianshenii TaxID=1463404 RepID=A0ABS2P5B1_9BACI|nr:hypothetical protein [Bacillus tianshenii]MBM7622069.1 hypothetical protein [Bacillus tianshenii]